MMPESDRKDVAWLTPDGTEISGAEWHGDGRALGVFFGARPLFAVLMNASDADVTFILPDCDRVTWGLVLDTALDAEKARPVPDNVGSSAVTYDVTRRSLAVFSGRLP
jgi:pullulanase/glycogen debranching enzyme